MSDDCRALHPAAPHQPWGLAAAGWGWGWMQAPAAARDEVLSLPPAPRELGRRGKINPKHDGKGCRRPPPPARVLGMQMPSPS